jgi:hypothetical protein
MGACRGTLKPVVLWVRLEIGFLWPFFVLPKGGGVSQVFWKEVSPWPIIYYLLGPPEVSPSSPTSQ